MVYLPPDILFYVVEDLWLTFRSPEWYQTADYNGYLKQLCSLRLVNRMFAESSVIKERLFRDITLRVLRTSSERLQATYETIAPYVRNVSFESSLFDVKLSKELYLRAFHDDMYAIAPDMTEVELLRSYEGYHARALEDQAAEDEIGRIWQQCVSSFRGVERIRIVDAWWLRGPDAGIPEKLSFLGFIQRKQGNVHPILDVINKHTWIRLLRLTIPLLHVPELQVKELYLSGRIESLVLSEDPMSALISLKRLDYCLEVASREEVEPNAPEGPVSPDQLLLAAMCLIELLCKCLEACQGSLEQLQIQTTAPSMDLFDSHGESLPSTIRCHQLRTLYLNGVYARMGSTQLISTIKLNFPNLECITINEPHAYHQDQDEEFWPDFLSKIREAVQGRKFRVEGEFDGVFSTLFFSPTLNVPYDRALKGFEEKTCNYRTALSVAIRQYVDGLASWDLVTNTIEELESPGWLGEYDGDADFEAEEEEGLKRVVEVS